MYKLPVWGTVSTVYAFIWHERMAWFKFALALLTLVLIGFALMMLQVFGISLLSENAEGNGLVIVLLGLIILFFLAYAALFLTFTVAGIATICFGLNPLLCANFSFGQSATGCF